MIYMQLMWPSMTTCTISFDSFFRRGDILEVIKSVNDWKKELGSALKSKADELQMMGYKEATDEDVWNCLVKKVWKGNPDKRLYEVIQDIFHLRSNIYMSYLTVDAYQSFQDEDLMASIQALMGNKT
jgi:hypothetical protein